ncbi:MAG: pilin [Candidatus Peregrinibacteria bacterium]
MKKLIKQIALLFFLVNLGLTIHLEIASAQDSTPYIGPLQEIQNIGEETGLPSFIESGQHPDAPPDYLQEGVGTATSPIFFALDFFRYVVSGIAILVIVIQAIKLISASSEEDAGKAKTALLMGVIGLIVIQLADVIVRKMFFGEQGEAFEDIATTQIYAEESVKQVRGIIGFVEVFVGAAAVLVIIIRGFTLVTSGGDEEAMTKAKNHLIYAVVGLAVVVLSEAVVRGVIFPEAGKELPDADKGRAVIIAITNYLAGFIAIIAFVGLFYGGYRFVVSGGEEESKEKIKKIILGSLIALILALGAFALVNTLLELKPPDPGLTETSQQP